MVSQVNEAVMTLNSVNSPTLHFMVLFQKHSNRDIKLYLHSNAKTL